MARKDQPSLGLPIFSMSFHRFTDVFNVLFLLIGLELGVACRPCAGWLTLLCSACDELRRARSEDNPDEERRKRAGLGRSTLEKGGVDPSSP